MEIMEPLTPVVCSTPPLVRSLLSSVRGLIFWETRAVGCLSYCTSLAASPQSLRYKSSCAESTLGQKHPEDHLKYTAGLFKSMAQGVSASCGAITATLSTR